MIGLIGPPDSTERCLEAARAVRLQDQVVTRTYTRLSEVPDLTYELDLACPVVMFTGTVPYTATRGLREWTGRHDYIAHTTGDLYHALIGMLVDAAGDMPRLSVDTVGIPGVRSMFEDIPVASPVFVDSPPNTHIDVAALATEHIDNITQGRADAAITCVSAVHKLVGSSAPSYRIQHSMSTLRMAISRGVLLSQVSVSESTQVAVGVIKLSGGAEPKSGTSEDTQAVLSSFADQLRGALVPVDHDRFAVYTTRGALEDAADRVSMGQVSPFDELTSLEGQVAVSFGIGTSVATAEELARRGTSHATSSRRPLIYGADGSINLIGGGRGGVVHERALPQIGIGPLSFRRLTRALHQVNTTRLTATDLANAYGVTERSARRILNRLSSVGAALETNEGSAGVRGRPKSVYRIDLDRLLALSRSDESSGTEPAIHVRN